MGLSDKLLLMDFGSVSEKEFVGVSVHEKDELSLPLDDRENVLDMDLSMVNEFLEGDSVSVVVGESEYDVLGDWVMDRDSGAVELNVL